MADADYGYVGTGVGQISLYKGYEVVEKNIPSEKAVDALINLIKEHGDWVELEEWKITKYSVKPVFQIGSFYRMFKGWNPDKVSWIIK